MYFLDFITSPNGMKLSLKITLNKGKVISNKMIQVMYQLKLSKSLFKTCKHSTNNYYSTGYNTEIFYGQDVTPFGKFYFRNDPLLRIFFAV